MSTHKDLGGCLWKLFQWAIVVAILMLGFMFITKPQGSEQEKLETKDLSGQRESTGSQSGLVAKLREVFGGGKKKQLKVGSGGAENGGDGVPNKLMKSQEVAGTGHVDLAKLLEMLEGDENVKKEVEFLAEGTTQIEQVLYWQIYDGNVFYRILLQPYDRKAHEMMMRPGEALFMSFLSAGGGRLVPQSADHRIDMRHLRVATKEGDAVGWFFDGHLPLDGASPETVARGKVGWIFSNGLHARLRQIQAPPKPSGETVTKPFSIDIPADDQGRRIGN